MLPFLAPLILFAALHAPGSPQDPADGEGAPIPPGFGLELEPGPLAEAWSRVEPGTEPADLGPDWPAPGEPAWQGPEVWEAWVAEVRAAAAGGPGAGLHRARLARLAALQGRSDAAWEHLRACADDPPLMAAALAVLLPGVPAGSAAGPGGSPLAVPAGVVLRPCAPPPTAGLEPGRYDIRAARVHAFRVGEALLSLEVQAEGDGVQVDVEHLEGPPVSLWVVIPSTRQLQIRVEYANWERQETVGEPLRVDLEPGGEPISLWGRAMAARVDWPVNLPGADFPRLVHGGLELEVSGDDPRRAELEGLAQALAELLGVPARLRSPGEPRPAGGDPLVLRLPAGPGRARKLGSILSLVERYVLANAAGR